MKSLFLTGVLLATGAGAQTVQDPTRPPAAFLHPAAGGQDRGAPALQSILVGRAAGGRRVAVIDGDTVRVGDVVRGARVVAITQGEVVLQRGARREVLTWKAAPDPGSALVPAAAPQPGTSE